MNMVIEENVLNNDNRVQPGQSRICGHMRTCSSKVWVTFSDHSLRESVGMKMWTVSSLPVETDAYTQVIVGAGLHLAGTHTYSLQY